MSVSLPGCQGKERPGGLECLGSVSCLANVYVCQPPRWGLGTLEGAHKLVDETSKEADSDALWCVARRWRWARGLCRADGGEGIMEAFLWEMVLVLRPELGGCERVGLIWTALGLEGAEGVECVWL